MTWNSGTMESAPSAPTNVDDMTTAELRAACVERGLDHGHTRQTLLMIEMFDDVVSIPGMLSMINKMVSAVRAAHYGEGVRVVMTEDTVTVTTWSPDETLRRTLKSRSWH